MIKHGKVPIILLVKWTYSLRSLMPIAVISLFFVTGCAFGKTDMSFSPYPDSIVMQVKVNVRSAKVYRDLDTILIADILWYKPELKRRNLIELSEKGRISEDEKMAMLNEIDEQESAEIEFLAGFYTGEKKWDDFDSDASIWKIRLEADDGSLVAPVRIEKLLLKEMPDSHNFPFLTRWKSPYRITFAKTENLSHLKSHKIRLRSILGEAKFIWESENAKSEETEPKDS